MGMHCSSGEILSPVAAQKGHGVLQLGPHGLRTHASQAPFLCGESCLFPRFSHLTPVPAPEGIGMS